LQGDHGVDRRLQELLFLDAGGRHLGIERQDHDERDQRPPPERATVDHAGDAGDEGDEKDLPGDAELIAQDLAGIDDASFAPIKGVLFDTGEEEALPLLNRVQAGVLLEVLKDMLYQCFVRQGKLTRAIKVRRFFIEDGKNDGLASTA